MASREIAGGRADPEAGAARFRAATAPRVAFGWIIKLLMGLAFPGCGPSHPRM
jgi:hypothetical protein